MKRYGYHRTSTKEQYLDRGIAEINAYCLANNLELEKIFTDQQTGKNFNRPRYLIMKEDVLRPAVMSIEAFAKEYAKVVSGELRPFQLMQQLGMSKATFYRYAKMIKRNDK